MSDRHRAWVFTIFLEDMPVDYGFMRRHCAADNFLQGVQSAKAIVFQLERAPETGALHFQGAVIFDNPVSLRSAKRRLERCWGRLIIKSPSLRPMRGNWADQQEYCKKEETRVEGPWEHGEPPAQGKRSDIVNLTAWFESCAQTNPSITMNSFLTFVELNHGQEARLSATAMLGRMGHWWRTMMMIHQERVMSNAQRTQPTVHVVVGAPGVGKTHSVESICRDSGRTLMKLTSMDGHSYNSHNQFTKVWFPPNAGLQEVLILDDFIPGASPELVRELTGGGHMQAHFKGGTTSVAYSHVIVITNTPPDRWFHDPDTEAAKAVMDRLTKVTYITETTSRRPATTTTSVSTAADLCLFD